MRFLSIALVTACLCLPAWGQIYKWVDEKGVTQYGQKPPADNKSQKMNMPAASPAATAGSPPARAPLASLKEQEFELNKRQIASQEAQVKAFKQAEAQKQWCVRAKDDLDRKRHARIYDLNDKGERIFKSDPDRDAFLAKVEGDYRQYCQ